MSIPAAAVLALVVVVPFEVPLRTFAFALTLTTVEAVIALTVLVSCGAMVYGRQPVIWRTPITAAVFACLAAGFVSALLSPVDQGNALRFAGRMLAAAAIAGVVVNAVTTRALARALVRTLVAVAAVVSVVALLEVAQVPSVMSALTLFRPGFHVVGGQLRATSTVLYPTVTSMYLEVAFALGLWLLLDHGPETKRRHGVAVFVALAVIVAGIVATFTRAGLLGVAAALGLAAAFHYAKVRRIDRAHRRLAGLAAVLVVLVLASRSPDVLLARVSNEGSQSWYGASYSAPASLAFTTGREYQVPVTVENTGHVIWDSATEPMFAMSYHWLRADSDAVVEFEGWRTPFPEPVAPGARVMLPVDVQAPGMPGRYVLVWDVVHERRAWLSSEGVAPARSFVEVTGPPVATATTPSMARLPAVNRRADRFTLWRAAVAIGLANPLFGIGPDNFRKVYGRFVDEPAFDTRVHANNMYLEVLAGGGIVGFIAVSWLMAGSGLALIRRWRRAPVGAPAATALCAAWLVIAGHGVVDSFLSFTTTYALFAVAAGLAFSRGMADADRL